MRNIKQISKLINVFDDCRRVIKPVPLCSADDKRRAELASLEERLVILRDHLTALQVELIEALADD